MEISGRFFVQRPLNSAKKKKIREIRIVNSQLPSIVDPSDSKWLFPFELTILLFNTWKNVNRQK